MNDTNIKGLKRLGVNVEYSRIFRIIDAIHKLQEVYSHDVTMPSALHPLWGLYYLGSNQNHCYTQTLLDLLQHLNSYRDDARVLKRCEEVGLLFKMGPYGIDDKIIRGLSTSFGIIWFDGIPGVNAPQRDLRWDIT